MSRAVNVFCAASEGARPEYAALARQVGAALASAGATVVYGGGGRGLMGALAEGALQRDGRVIGVIPGFMVHKERAHRGIAELRLVNSMPERKQVMADLADAFLALPGGVGTLDELFEVITWRQLGLHRKPIVVCDAFGCFGPLRAWFERAVTDGFVPPATVPAFEPDPDAAVQAVLLEKPG